MGEDVDQRTQGRQRWEGQPRKEDLPPPVAGTSGCHPGGCPGGAPAEGERGQTTAEYALVLLGAAAVALLLIGWATQTDQVSRLFDFVVDQVVGRAR